jgi:hypothetical protein
MKDSIEAFRRDGAVCLRSVIGPEWFAPLAKAIERDIADPGPFFHNYQVEKGRFHGNSVVWVRHPEFADYAFDSPLPELAAAFLGADRLNLLYDQLFVKEPGTSAPTPWHHDHCVWPIAGQQVISFWLALDPVDAGNGRVEFVKGSHLWDGLFQPESFSKSALSYPKDPRLKPMPDINAKRDEYEILTWDMEPGDLVVFTSRTVHGAGPNDSMRRRRGYTVRYCGDDVTYDTSFAHVPYLRNPELKTGDRLDSALFPLVWKDGSRTARPVPPRMEDLIALDAGAGLR